MQWFFELYLDLQRKIKVCSKKLGLTYKALHQAYNMMQFKELADYVSFPALSGTVVASFVVCSYVLFDI